MTVVDTNIVAYLLIEGDRTTQARQLWESDPGWYLPELWRHEFLNVLASYTQHKLAPLADMLDVWRMANNLFSPSERPVNMESALQIATKFQISAYDAQFVELAQSLNTLLVTEDKVLLRRFPESTRSLGNSIQ